MRQKEPRIAHNCEVPKPDDEIESHIVGTRLIDKIRRWIIRRSILSRNHPITKTCIKSSAAINYEINRHIRFYPYTIYPFSQIRSFWETWMIIFTIISLIIVPLILAFDFHTPENWFNVILVINIVFSVDIILWFFTGHYDDITRIIILDRKIVAGKYLKGFFVLDLLASIPIELFCVMITGSGKVKWYCTALNLMKIFRIRTIVLYSRKLRYLYRISFQKYKIFKMSIIIMLSIHWASCLELYVALAGSQIDWKTINHGSWLLSEGMKDKNTKLKMYLACANRAAVSLVCSSHYLDMKTTEDILLNLVLTVVGRIGFIYIIAQFLKLMTTFHSTSKRNLKLLRQLQGYMQYKELPYPFQRRLLDYYKFCSKKSFDRDKNIINQVSPHLREELLLHNYSRLIDSVNYFQHLPQSVVAQIVGFLRIEVYLTNDTIVMSGSVGEALFFIASGTVAIYASTGKEMCHLEEGAHFGEVSLVMENEQIIASVVAVEICEIWILKRSDFLLSISPYPNLLNRLQKIAVKHLEKNLLGEAYRNSGANITRVNLNDQMRDRNEENS